MYKLQENPPNKELKENQKKSREIKVMHGQVDASRDKSQHFGRSDGGGDNFWLGSFPSKTIHAILKPQLR